VEDTGKLILRLTVGILMLLHGAAKITGGIGSVSGMLESAGLPRELAYGVYIGEILAPLLVVFGFYARIGALVVVVNMLFAIYLAHTGDLFRLARTGGWALELQAFFLLGALCIALIGPGRYGFNRR
jgi:putative oxidoreductase